MGLIAPEPAPTRGAARALVVNAEPQCLVGLRIVLRGAGYIVESAQTAADALALVADDPPDVLVLDLALPDGVGAALCAGVRELSEVPILLLSPPNAQRERLLALNAGADDYVAKPFRRQELLDRLSGVAPASVGVPASSPLELGDLVIDPARRRVSRAGAVCSPTGTCCGSRGAKNAERTHVAFASLSRVCAPSWRGTRGVPGT
jgi:DNA-binding response OmpR family regulator